MAWRVPRIWEGGECWIIGGGPSVVEQFEIPQDIVQQVRNKTLTPSAYSPFMSAIHNKHVIGINMAFRIGDWIDMCFFGDKRWFFTNRRDLAKFPGLKVTNNPHFTGDKYRSEGIRYLARDRNHPKGISSSPTHASWNSNSGAASISVAVHMGVKRIILLGFDMRRDEDKNQHWHTLYIAPGKTALAERALPFHRHLRGFPIIAQDARTHGVEILNASPNSAIPDFPKTTVKELLYEQAV